MGKVSFRNVTEAVRNFLDDGTFKQVQAGQSLTESIPETALIQVYIDAKNMQSTATDRLSFGGAKRQNADIDQPVRPNRWTVNVDVYCRQRSDIGTDMAAVEDRANYVDELLGTQVNSPFFGLDGIKTFTFRMERVTFDYNKVSYVGVRFILDLTIL